MRHFVAILLLLTAFVGRVVAADELDVARAALRDGLWEIARSHAALVNTNDARLVILESYAGEGKWDEIAKRLAEWKNFKSDGLDYYRAVVRGDHASAMNLLKVGGSSEGVVEAKMYEAGELAKSGDRKAAEVIWREVVATTNVGDRVFAIASMNLRDADLLRRAWRNVRDAKLGRRVALCLGTVLLKDNSTAAEGAKVIRGIVSDSPDTEGAQDAFMAMADAEMSAERWNGAYDIYREIVEIWPNASKTGQVNEGIGWALLKLGKLDESLAAFKRAEEFAVDYDMKAVAIMKQGDVLSEMGRGEESMARYRTVVGKYPKSSVAGRLQKIIAIREKENRGRDLYREFRFESARKLFSEVAGEDASRKPRMDFFEVLCLYGQGLDDEAAAKAESLSKDCPDAGVRAEALLWLAKLEYNRREWKKSLGCFVEFAKRSGSGAPADEALLWAARAAFSANDFDHAVQLSTLVVEGRPDSAVRSQALLVQGESLMELARYDEAVLVLERLVIAKETLPTDRLRAQVLKADALYAMGADNPVRYTAALEAYNAIQFGGAISPSGAIVVAFKIARVLEKLKRLEEALDQYYVRVVLAYREGRERHERYDEEARAAFSRAAFRLADEFESRGKNRQAVAILDLVVASDVPAAAEAAKRIKRISAKGSLL